MTLEEYIRSKLTKSLDGEFMFDAWADVDGKLHIIFIGWKANGPEFVVAGNTATLAEGDEDNGTNVRN